MIYKPHYFGIEELVDNHTLQKFGEARCWLMFDDRILKAADIIREDFGRMVVNNWMQGGNRTESGLRVPGMKHFRATSQHAFGRALDMIPLDADLESIQIAITSDRERYGLITGLEIGDSVTWLHIDCRNNTNLQRFGI